MTNKIYESSFEGNFYIPRCDFDVSISGNELCFDAKQDMYNPGWAHLTKEEAHALRDFLNNHYPKEPTHDK
jgi:hypothetical protein